MLLRLVTREGAGGPDLDAEPAHCLGDWGFRIPRLQAAQVVFTVVTNLTARLR